MSQQQLHELFRRMVEGDPDAARQLEDWLRVRGARAAGGDAFARNELEELAYSISVEYVERRMRCDFRFLIDRHSAASVVHQAWLRLLGPAPKSLEDLVSLCHRIGHMVHFALLDIVASQRNWDKRHHAPICQGGATADEPEAALGQVEGGGSLDPSRLAVWSEFHERAASLPEATREVFKLGYYLGMARRAIAARLGITEHRVRVLWLEALQRLGNGLPDLP